MPTHSTAQRLLPHLRRVALGRDTEVGDGQLLGQFVVARDGDAFAALVRRHGPMVLGVCRRVVSDVHLAEDAFQATFLVLARRAATVRPRHLVGHWLYGVAYRTALKARSSAARRKAKEKQVDAMPHPPVSPPDAWADVQPVLDAELARLPEKYRVPVVLCDLGGRPQRDVARELGLPPATLANRLAAARRLLAKRLTERGVALSAGAVAAALGWHAATSAVPPGLSAAVVKAACAAAAGAPVGLPVPVVQLSEGVMRMFVLAKLKAVAAGVATCLLLLAGLGLFAAPTLRAGPDDKPGKSANPPANTDPDRARVPDDLVFLRRMSLDLRGIPPTSIEVHYFLADTDPKKRAKIIEWMLPEHGKQKVTATCASCHREPALGHGAALGDFDADGWLDLYITGKLNHRGHTTPHDVTVLDEWYSLMAERAAGDKADDKLELNVALFRIDVEKARAEVDKAEAALKTVQKRWEARIGSDRERQAQVDQAQVDLHAARVRLKQAETQLTDAEQARRAAARTRRFRETMSDLERTTKDLDSRLQGEWQSLRKGGPSDAEFLRRVLLDFAGRHPTTVEEKYFAADKDPRKREKVLGLLGGPAKGGTGRDKLVDELLADPEVQKRWVELWKVRMERDRQKLAIEGRVTKSPGDRLTRLLAELLDGKRSDEQVLDALCLATMARFATETEKKLIVTGLKEQSDRRAAWEGVLRALAGTQEAKAHAEGLSKRGQK